MKLRKKVQLTRERYQELLEKEKIADTKLKSEVFLELFRGKRLAEAKVKELRLKLDRIHVESRGEV